MSNISTITICHKCRYRQRSCAGPCSCLIDPEHRDILIMVQVGCPKNYFNRPPCPRCGSQDHQLKDCPIQLTPEQAAAEAKRGGCCNGGENAG